MRGLVPDRALSLRVGAAPARRDCLAWRRSHREEAALTSRTVGISEPRSKGRVFVYERLRRFDMPLVVPAGINRGL
jgi:hypothetical protein